MCTIEDIKQVMQLENIKTIVSDLETKGIVVFPGFFDKDTVAALSSEGKKLIDNEVPFVEYFRNGDSCRVATAPCNLDVHHAWKEFSVATEALRTSGVDSIADAFLGSGAGRSHFIYDYSIPSPGKELFPLHFDNFDGQRCLKAFIYLTDCDRTNGAFRYIPGSQHLAYAHVAAIWKTIKGKKNTGYHFLHEFLKQGNEQLSKLATDDAGAKETLERLHSIVKSPETSYEYCVNGSAGTLVIFDTMGVHGGGEVTSSDRFIFRCHYVDSGFVFKHLYDQLPLLKAIVSKVLRRLRF